MSDADSHSVCFLGLPTIAEWIHSEAFGSVQRQISILARELATRGYDVTVISPKPGPTTFQRHEIDHIGIPSNADLTKDPIERGSAYLDALQKADSDIYYLRGASEFLPLIWKYTQLSDTEYIFHMTDVSSYPHQGDNRFGSETRDIFDTAVEDATTLITQTKQQKTTIQSQYNREVTVLPDCYDLPATEDLTSPEEREYFLWIERLQPERNPMQFLELADQLPDHQFRMHGPIKEGSEFHKTVKERAQSYENVNFCGFIPIDERPTLYSEAIAVINTAKRSGFPTSLVQAWVYGTPTLSQYDILEEIPYSTNTHTCTGSFEGLLKAVSRFAYRMPLLDHYDSTRKTVESHYFTDTLVSDYEEIIHQSLSN